jgi:hypothetical protein
MALRGDELFISYGVMGGFMQPQGHIQVLLNMLRGMAPQSALDAPRFCISAGSPDSEVKSQGGQAGDINSEVYLEDGISTETIEALRGRCKARLNTTHNTHKQSSNGPRCPPVYRYSARSVGPWPNHSETDRSVRSPCLGSWLGFASRRNGSSSDLRTRMWYSKSKYNDAPYQIPTS